MLYVGIDFHSKRIPICVLNKNGSIVHPNQIRTIDQMMRTLEGLSERFEVYFEPNCGYGHVT